MTMFGREAGETGHIFVVQPDVAEEVDYMGEEEVVDIAERDAAVERRYTSPGERASAMRRIRDSKIAIMGLIYRAAENAGERALSLQAAAEMCNEALELIEASNNVLWPREARFRRLMAQILDMQQFRGRARKQRLLAAIVEKKMEERGVLMLSSW